jgi:putative ABC transport system permease protein
VGTRLRIRAGDGPAERVVEVVGVVSDPVRSFDGTGVAALFLPMPDATPTSLWFFAKTATPDAVLATLRARTAQVDSHVPLATVGTEADLICRAAGPMRYSAYGLGLLSTLALLLAASGLHAVTAYVVSLRTREIGARMAIGAQPSQVVAMVIRGAVRLVLLGSATGLLIALPITFALRTMFIGISPADPLAMLPTLGILLAVAILAAAYPARRAARIDPIAALRAE